MINTRKLISAGINRNVSKKFKFNKDLAEALGVDRAVLSGWMAGNIFPRPETIDAIADKLGVNPSMLLCTAEEQKALELGLHIQANPELEHAVQLCASLTSDDLAFVIRFAELATNQN